jgi:predicted histone-like DNA-binding protein
MSVTYKALPKVNPQNPAAAPKYYAQVVTSGEITLRQLAKMISEVATVKTADTMAVLEGLLNVVPMVLADGKIVRLGDFGSFNLQVSSDGAATPDELTRNQINKISVKFRAAKEFMIVINNIEFTKIK